MIKIDKGVKIPPRRSESSRPYKYPWLEMKVGDSFLVTDKSAELFYSHVSGAGKRYNRKFTTRKVDGGVRVWRVE